MAKYGTTDLKEAVEAFCNFCVVTRSIYEHYRALFDAVPSNLEILEKTAPLFFSDVNRVFIEYVILQVCKITDPEMSNGQNNLTIEFLINSADFSDAPNDLRELERLRTNIHHFREKLKPARNKLISHLDLKSVSADEPLGAVPQNEWDDFWQNLQLLIYILYKRYVDNTAEFYLNAGGSDAGMLVHVIMQARQV